MGRKVEFKNNVTGQENLRSKDVELKQTQMELTKR